MAGVEHFEGAFESLHAVYLINSKVVLAGVVPLARILLAEPGTPLKGLASESLISVEAHADQKTVVDLFHKYNLLSLPVVDDNGHMLGVITADDVIELMMTRT